MITVLSIIGYAMAALVLKIYSSNRGWIFKLIFFGIVFCSVFVATLLIFKYDINDVWWVRLFAPVTCAILSTFLALLIKPYSPEEAMQGVRVYNYIDKFDRSDNLLQCLKQIEMENPNINIRPQLIRLIYSLRSSYEESEGVIADMVCECCDILNTEDSTILEVEMVVVSTLRNYVSQSKVTANFYYANINIEMYIYNCFLIYLGGRYTSLIRKGN